MLDYQVEIAAMQVDLGKISTVELTKWVRQHYGMEMNLRTAYRIAKMMKIAYNMGYRHATDFIATGERIPYHTK